MMHNSIQLMVYGPNVGELVPSINHAGLTVAGSHTVDSINYLFVDVTIDASAKPGAVAIDFSKDGAVVATHEWTLLEREAGSKDRKGFDSSDVVYLFMPDRFANGDPSNDIVPGMRQATIDRSDPGGRHGGDIAGIKQHLDYIHDMGYTAIWPNPLLENNHEGYSYHGYSTTDYFKVDPRYGTNEDYRDLVHAARDKGIKFIMVCRALNVDTLRF